MANTTSEILNKALEKLRDYLKDLEKDARYEPIVSRTRFSIDRDNIIDGYCLRAVCRTASGQRIVNSQVISHDAVYMANEAVVADMLYHSARAMIEEMREQLVQHSLINNTHNNQMHQLQSQMYLQSQMLDQLSNNFWDKPYQERIEEVKKPAPKRTRWTAIAETVEKRNSNG